MFDSFEINKIAGAVLASILAVFAINEIGHVLVHPHELEAAVYVPDGTEMFEAGAAPVAADADEGPESAVPLLASVDPANGEKVFKKCTSCHTIEDGGKNGTGPNLHGVVGRAKGMVDGFSYSGALMEKGGTWSYESLDAFLRKPKDYISGTKMSFAGIKKTEDRAELIAYLAQNTPNAPAFPAVEAPAEEAAPVEEAAAATDEAMEQAGDAAEEMADEAAGAVEDAAEEAAGAAEDAAPEAVEETAPAH